MTVEEQVVVFAPIGRDAALACDMLRQAGTPARTADSFDALIALIREHAGVVVLAEEALTPEALAVLERELDAQPQWSDIPLIVLAGREFSTSPLRPLNVLGPLRNVMILERPVPRLIFVRAVEVALRSRRRQFEMRAYLQSRMELLQREQELNRLKDEFLMTVSHELRTPLTAIVGWARMLTTGEVRESHRQRALEIIERNASAQVQLVNDLLDVSRAISGKTRLNMQPLDMRAVVTAAVDTVLPAANAKGIELETLLGDRSSPVIGDPGRLQQVVWNLLSNAIKFTPRGGQVRVSVQVDSDMSVVAVTDSGAGIRPEFLPYVFDNFRQGDAGTTRQTGGLGLGLAIARHLIELHGGTVQADSRGPGQGATFRLRLPIVRADSEAAGARPSVTIDTGRLDGRRILVIDDDHDTQELFSEILSRAGADTRIAGSVAEGLALAADFHPDLVLSDIEMPTVDGYSLIPLLHQQSGHAPVAIAVSAHARDEDRKRALDAGFATHLAKPISPADLIAAVEALTVH